MGSAFAVLTHTTGSVGPSQVPARGRRRNKLAQDAKLAEDHSNLAKSSQGHDALHQRILESAHQRQLAMDKERGESRHVIKARGPKFRLEDRTRVAKEDDVILQKAHLYHQRQLAMGKDTMRARHPHNRQDKHAKQTHQAAVFRHDDCEDKGGFGDTSSARSVSTVSTGVFSRAQHL
eukprot:GHVU01212529.1.p1 GENE.GHVU01212529.1~~GHVU01212529.1.p1  ORF type:complete len:193 (-),score=23.77 GHVU01212529.1:752-1282(-)